ncbi:MAG: multiphosphoryl transfer protein [Solirubrobacteraceae bacterium]|nr:multiphosphoryl transfer protein [Solirubrobacteraceae bacterium]
MPGAGELRGVPAAPGVAVGAVRLLAAPVPTGVRVAPEARAAEFDAARLALEKAAAQLDALAAALTAQGRADEAEIVATGALMALDPGLEKAVEELIGEEGLAAPAALFAACAAQADVLAALDDPMLAARADDVRSLGRRAASLAAGGAGSEAVEGRDEVLVADDLGPADVAELGSGVRAIALAGGGATAHAAIVARSLGLPMVAGLGADVLALEEGEPLIVDGAAGLVVAGAPRERLDAARSVVRRREQAREHVRAQRHLPAQTVDGRRLTVLANVAGPAELQLALEAGAEGIGLLRTELGFLDAADWPSQADHLAMLAPILAGLDGLPATVRTLDFGGDKTPPFLAGEDRRGIGLLLAAPQALRAQLRAILEAGAGVDLRVLFPLVSSSGELAAAAAALGEAAGELGVAVPPLGPMIETPGAADSAGVLAARASFLSIGTNDLASATLGVDRFAAGRSLAHHPRVLGAIGATVRAGRRAGIAVEVCGEAASDPLCLPLLVGLGVDELSVGASRVGTVRAWVRELSHADCTRLATRALAASTPEEVEALVAPVARRLASAEGGDAVAQGLEGARGVVAAGGQP